jgi:hypothetical protein
MFYKLLILFFISSVKFIFAFPLALKYHFEFYITLFITILGGITGVLFFAFISAEILIFYTWFIHNFLHRYPRFRRFAKKIKDAIRKKYPKKEKKIFSKKSKWFVRIKQNYGLAGIAFLTPFLLSIPLGTFLAIRFYSRSNYTLLYLILGVIFWAIVGSIIIHFTQIRF